MIQQMLVIWSLVPLSFLNPAWTSESAWFMYCWSLAWWILSITQGLGGHTQNLLCTRTQDKGAVIPQETGPNLSVSVQESPVEAWVSGGLLKGQGTECSSVCMDLLKEVTIVFSTSTIVWPQIEQQGGDTALPINRKLDLRFPEHGPAHQNKTEFYPLSLSPIRKLP